MSLLWHAKNRGDHRTEGLLCVINLKTWETKMHIALTASHDLGTRAFRFHVVRLIRKPSTTSSSPASSGSRIDCRGRAIPHLLRHPGEGDVLGVDGGIHLGGLP